MKYNKACFNQGIFLIRDKCDCFFFFNYEEIIYIIRIRLKVLLTL